MRRHLLFVSLSIGLVALPSLARVAATQPRVSSCRNGEFRALRLVGAGGRRGRCGGPS
jgi:hypothetical protein